ncbi:MAG: aspartate/glutamate racemase family protein [Actinobacteria bacterium]|nr:aspartate/glutamate racemase family protein [Actinomycetota bacterium]
MRIAVIDPVARDTSEFQIPEISGVEIMRSNLRWGTASIESRWDDELAASGVIDAAIRAEHDGADAIVVNCMDDPGVDAAREVVRIPVVGPAHAAMQLALCLATRFSIVTTTAADVPIVQELIERYGLDQRATPVTSLGLGVMQLEDDAEATFEAAAAAAARAVTVDGAGALIAGCTLLSPHIERLQHHLAAAGYEVPIIDPLTAALQSAKSLVMQRQTHSARAFVAPSAKPMTWFDPEAELGAGEVR